MSTAEVVVHRDGAGLAAAIAARLITAVTEAQSLTEEAELCLTGGGIGIALLAAVRDTTARDAVDWTRVGIWWSDERYLPRGDQERNETQARLALLDHLALDPSRVHPMAASGEHPTVEDAAAAYAHELQLAAAATGHGSPAFDVCLLGIGPDAHVASLFPEHPALHEGGIVVAVHGSPKPPPVRISLTMQALRRSRQVWVVASGAAKAGAVRLALDENAGPLQVPAAAARGQDRTLFLLDEAAASALPSGLQRLASP